MKFKWISHYKIGWNKRYDNFYFNLDFTTGVTITKYADSDILIYIHILGLGIRLLFD